MGQGKQAGKGKRRARSSWAPGQSGNPRGRPKVAAEVRDLARTHSAVAIATLASLMRGAEKDDVRLRAAEALLDRAWGRPAQAAESADDPRDFHVTIDIPVAHMPPKAVLEGHETRGDARGRDW